MKKTFVALVAVATVAGSLSVTPGACPARRRRGHGCRPDRRRDRRWRDCRQPPGLWLPAPAYVDEGPYPACRMVRERFWDGYGWRVRRYEVCN